MTPERVETSDIDSGFSDGSVGRSVGPIRRARVSRTKPTCNKCKNHKRIEPLSGHKRYCPYATCPCDLCLLTQERRCVMAAQTRQKRAQVQDERNGLPLEQRAPVLPPQTTEPPTVSPKPAPRVATIIYDAKTARKPKKTAVAEEQETAVESAQRLVCEFGVAYPVVPFALALLKRVGSYNLVSKIIIEIQEALLEKTKLTASWVHDRPPIFAHGPNYIPYNTDPCGAIPLLRRPRES